MMVFVACDLEGVFVPEIWIEVANALGLEELRLTTREEKDYDKLMRMRIGALRKNNVKFADIAKIISGMEPYEGALDFLERIRRLCSVAIVSDTFWEFFNSGLAGKLGNPFVFCHDLTFKDGYIDGYRLRLAESKIRTVEAMRALRYKVFAFGDSYNDIGMLRAADRGCLFRSPENITSENPDIPSTGEYDVLYDMIGKFVKSEGAR